MADFVFFITNDGDPLIAPVDVPEVTLYRNDTQSLEQAATPVTEVGGGFYYYPYATTDGINISAVCDADPNVTGQTTPAERYVPAVVSGTTEARIDDDIPTIRLATSFNVLRSLVVAAGSTSTVVKTDATEADDFWNGHPLTIANASGSVTRLILSYSNTEGAFTVAEAYPFTPAASDVATITPTPQLALYLAIQEILADTSTTLPATLTSIEGKVDTVDTVVDTIDTNVDAVLFDTGTTIPASLTTIEGKVDTVDTVVDAIFVDTGTTLSVAIEKIRKVTTNRVLISDDDLLVTIFEDDDTTPAFQLAVTPNRRDRTPV